MKTCMFCEKKLLTPEEIDEGMCNECLQNIKDQTELEA